MLASESRLLMKVASHAVREIMGDPRREGKGLY